LSRFFWLSDELLVFLLELADIAETTDVGLVGL